MATPAAVLSLLVKTDGAQAAAAQLTKLEGAARKTSAAADRSAGSLMRSGAAARSAASGFSLMSASAARSQRTVEGLARSAGRVARYGGLAGALGLGKVIKDGISFNATMEQNRIAFTGFLGSAKAANKELRALYQLAKTTPFEFTDVTLASRKLMAMGFTVKEANRELRLLADAASGAALGADGINRMVLALGQIKSKGVLQMEDLRQLQELGVINFKQLGADLGLTAQELGNVGKAGVPAAAAIAAINRQFSGPMFAGQSAKQAQTLNGQISTLRDNYKQFVGALTTSAFDFSKTIFGKLNKALGEINAEFRAHPKLSLSAKIEIAKDKLAPVARDIAHTIGDQLQKAQLGDKIVNALDKAIPVVAKAGGRLGLAMVKSFAKAFVQGDALTKLALGAFFISKFVGWGNIFRKLGSTAGKRFAAQFAAETSASIAASIAADGTVGSTLTSKGKWGRLGKLAGRSFGVAAVAMIAYQFRDQISDQIKEALGGKTKLQQGVDKAISKVRAGSNVSGLLGGLVGGIGAKTEPSANASAIIAVGRQMGASRKQILAALEAGIVESGLRNLPYGDRDSVGVFQQRPSQGWTGLRNVPKAAREFFQHAMQVGGKGMSAGQLAQAVQRSAFPGRYDQVEGKALKYLGGGGGGGGGRGGATGPIKYKRVGATTGGDNTAVETAALQNAIRFLKRNYPGIGYLLEDKGGKNQHLHINSANHKAIRQIARQLNEMGFNVGEYGGKPIPGIGGITTLKHKRYGAADHYHGGAVDVNTDQLIRIFSKRNPLDKPGANVFKAPQITQADFMKFVQSRLDHFDLMVRAGLMSAGKALLKKRAAIKSRLPYLTGDTKLEALAMLRELGTGKTPAQKTWTPEAKRRLAMAVIQANPGNVANLPAGVLKAAGASATMQNPWVQAYQQNLTNQVGAGVMTQAQADKALAEVLTRSLPFLIGQDAADVRTKLNEIATNTKDAAKAALETANSVRASGISDAGFLGGLTGPAATAVIGALNAAGIDFIPGGVSALSAIGNPHAAAALAQADIGTLMQEVASGQVTFADVWPQIANDLQVIAADAGQAAEATDANTQAIKDLQDEIKRQTDFATSVANTESAAMARWVTEVISKQMGFGISGRGQTPGYGVARRS